MVGGGWQAGKERPDSPLESRCYGSGETTKAACPKEKEHQAPPRRPGARSLTSNPDAAQSLPQRHHARYFTGQP